MLVVNEGRLSYRTVIETPPETPQSLRRLDNLSRVLAGYRIRNKLSKAAMSRLFGVSTNTYINWENKGMMPDIIYTDRITEALRREVKSISCGQKLVPARKKNYFRSMKSMVRIVDKLEKLQAVDKTNESRC